MERRELSEKQRFWFEHLRDCDEAGLSMKAYAERHGLDLRQFYFWKGRLKKLGAAVGVCGREPEFDVVPVVTGSAPVLSIRIDSDIRIEVSRDFNVEALAALLKLAVRL